ncbi:hypothetical protein EST38_g6634 [Candolleomyces aberdarensis]|uniref:Uncharacterized protein n=1 Tax=Candolleomyces aberdarensis TaxID=2316362 RepID=A0A4Q2DH62_9AGAR|nr:hypothetical protein EST38_g6634 [Candolleomyces aberdarensis]
MASRNSRSAMKEQLQSRANAYEFEKPKLVFPPSPTSSCTIAPSSPREDDLMKSDTEGWATSSTFTVTPAVTITDLPLVPLLELQPETRMEITAKAAASPDILAIAQLQASMKDALQGLAKAFNQIETQTERMNQLTLEIKAREQLEALRNELETQIRQQKEELDALKQTLETRITEVVTNHIKSQVYDMIKDSLATVIEDKFDGWRE